MLNVKKLFSKSEMADGKDEIVDLEHIEEPAEKVNSSTEDAGELIAAISAALAVFMGRENNLIVRSIRRVEDHTPVWGKVSRQVQTLSRL